MKLAIRPLTPARWPDLEAIFLAKGCSVARGCWCMYYRLRGAPTPPAGMTRGDFFRKKLRTITNSGAPPGLIAYHGKIPVGWVTLGPREEFKKLEHSPVMRPVDDQPVWSIVCFVVPQIYRGHGVAQALLEGAVAFAKKRGAKLVEGYPMDRQDRPRDDAMWFGTKSMFDRAGFKEVARRKPRRPIVRKRLARA
jgi:GNAT superfamily N-acetyltransferase